MINFLKKFFCSHKLNLQTIQMLEDNEYVAYYKCDKCGHLLEDMILFDELEEQLT